jgi:glucose/arabinose dehydrogenase
MSHRGTADGVLAFAIALLTLLLPSAAAGVTLPPGFEESTVITGLRAPTAIEFAPNGRVFVAEKSGIVKTFDSIADTTPTVFADLRTQVYNYSDRGLLSIAIDPEFPARPYVYVFYVHDAAIGGTAPRWGQSGATNDPCPNPPGDTADGCVVSGRIARLRAEGQVMSGPETVLVEDFCEQFLTDTGGGLEFGADGNLYMAAGDGAASHAWDYGQFGQPLNPCGDPPGGPGAALTPPTAEGGRLRAQDLRTAGDPVGLAGSLIRIDPATGAAVPGNPGFFSLDANQRRILAYGLRNPYRIAIRPGTNDVWIADRGHGYWSELDRVPNPTDPVRNFGWPCYEGALDANGTPYARIRPRSDDQNLNICENLYAARTATTPPYWAYDHELQIVPDEDCRENAAGAPYNTSLSGLEFYPQSGGSFPAAYRGALFFGDRWRDCIWAMLPGPDGLPQRGSVVKFAQRAESPLDLEVGTDGDLYYVDSETEVVKRFRFVSGGDGYARPKAASPLHVMLVPAYAPCTAPNALHGPPLAHPSCARPAPASARLTVGTPDANERAASSIGSVRYSAEPGDPGTPADEADVIYAFSLSDVRNSADLSDYTGELQGRVTVRITDRGSGTSATEPATTTDVVLRATVQCAASAAAGVGATCDLSTTLDALTPGLVREGARSIWELGPVEVLDGGSDGVAATAGNEVFMRQGLFIP